MPLIPLALHLPPLLLRLLLLLLPFPPNSKSPPPLGATRRSRNHQSNHPGPAQRPRPLPVHSRPAPARPVTAGIQASPPAARRYPPKCAPARVRSFLEKTPCRAQDPEPAPPAASSARLHPVPSTPRTRIVADSSARRSVPSVGGLAAPPAYPFPPRRPRPSRFADPPKKRAKNSLSPARPLWGRAGEREFPPKSPTLFPPPPCRPCGHEGKACTLRAKSSTVIPESRS